MPNDNTPHKSRAAEHDGPNRRRVLKAAAIGAASTIGVAGTAAARPAAFESPDAMRDAFADHEDLLADLADRGLVEGRTAAELTLDPAGADRADGHEVVRRRWTGTGGAVTEVKLVRRTDEGPLTVAVRPETGDSYAVLDGEVVEPLDSCCPECTEVVCCSCCDEDGLCQQFCLGCVCAC